MNAQTIVSQQQRLYKDSIALRDISHKLAVIASFLLPLKLAPTYVFLLPSIAFFLASYFVSYEKNSYVHHTDRFLVSFLGIAMACSLFGVDPIRSLTELSAISYYAVWILVCRSLVEKSGYGSILTPLLAGGTLSALLSIIAYTIYGKPVEFLVGTVSQSGQLMLLTIMASGLFFVQDSRYTTKRAVMFLILCFGTSTTIFYHSLFPNYTLPTLLSIVVIARTFFLLSSRTLSREERAHSFLLFPICPLLISNLLINLKRGPWFGTAIALGSLMFLFRKSLLLPFFTMLVIISTAIAPVRQRLYEVARDFFIVGGRSEIWSIATEIIQKYPMGVGFKNSRVLLDFSRTIPPELTHFHNNFLNIIAETGLVSFSLFLLWYGSLLYTGFFAGSKTKVVAASCLLGWQCAGVIEYNFADSEVMLVAFIFAGILTSGKSRVSTH